ncbi:MAG: hypothetical protein U0073_00465 [Bacteroidia bacterium]
MRTYLSVLLLFIIACTPAGNQKAAVVESATEQSSANSSQPVASIQEEPEDTNYVRHIEFGEYKLTASLSGAGKNSLNVSVQKGDSVYPSYIRECSGQRLATCFVSDLNSNDFIEFNVATANTIVSSGATGSLYSYEIKKNGVIRETLLPAMTDAMKKGYRGNEQWIVEQNQKVLRRKFKLYLITDADCCPTGGERSCFYTMDADGNLLFKSTESLERVGGQMK